MRITTLICTHNRLALLQRTLGFLDAARRPPGADARLLVVANGCSDGTRQWLERRARERTDGHLVLDWLEEPKLGKCNALNLAIDWLQRQGVDRDHLVALVDDDHRVDPGYLEGALRAAREFPDATLFCGKIIPDWDGREPRWVHDNGEYRIYPLPVPRFDKGEVPGEMTPEVGIPGGGNLVLRGDIFSRVGKFSVAMGPKGHDLAGGEDGEFVLRAMHGGETVWYVPYVVQYHYVDLARLRVDYLIRKSFRRTYDSSRLHIERRQKIPLYLWRKVATYSCKAVCSFNWTRTRFYLVRLAAALGEVRARFAP